VEFVRDTEVMGLLQDHGITTTSPDDDRVYLEMDKADAVVRLHLTSEDQPVEPADGARVITMAQDDLAKAIDGIVHKLHMSQILLLPVGKWRDVFDAVAFSLADNEEWQAVDTAATVELNSRDPLLCEPVDFHIVSALMRALITDADRAEQGLMLTTTGAPVLVEVVPEGAVRLSFGNQVLADEAAEALVG